MPMSPLPPLESLLADARAATGLSDFGEGDFREGLEMLLASAGRQLDLNDAGRAGFLALIRQRLTSRLEIERWYRDHPETEDVAIGSTTSITGLPRTGTTALVNLLSIDGRFRCLRAWEQTRPVPPPILAEEADDPRRSAAIERNAVMIRSNPALAAMHLFDPDATEEDVELLGLAFHAQQSAYPIFDYHRWWRTADMRPSLRYHRRVVKLLQSRRPPDRWLFKAPAHTFFLEPLLETYPDTKVIMTHRDPARVVPSVISLLRALLPAQPAVGIAEFARHHAEHFRLGVERAMAARASIGEDRFLDVHHHDFVADPLGTVGRVYAFLNLPLDGALIDRMTAWHARNRSGAHGTHRYTAEEFGLTAAGIRSDFRDYIDRFGIRLEG